MKEETKKKQPLWKKLGWAAFLFFLIKGIVVWIILPILAYYFGVKIF